MQYLAKAIIGLSTITKWGALITLLLMMGLISFNVISRSVFNVPIVGDYELVQLMMVVLVALGFGYSERVNAHIKVGLLVDRFNPKVQAVFDIFTYILVAIVCFIIAFIQFQAGLKALSTFSVTTSILQIPHYPFQFLLGLGLLIWGLESVLKVIYRSIELVNGKVYIEEEGSDLNVS